MKIKQLLVILLVLFAILPSLITMTVSGYHYNKKATELVRENIATTASLKAESVRNFFDQTRAALKIMTTIPGILNFLDMVNNSVPTEAAIGSATRILNVQLEEQPYSVGLFIAGQNDMVALCDDPYFVGKSISFVANIHNIPEGETAITTMMGEKSYTGTALTCIATPVYVKNEYQGFIAILIDPALYNDTVSNVDNFPSGSVTIVAKNDEILATSSDTVYKSIYNFPPNNDFVKQWRAIDFKNHPTGEIDYHIVNDSRYGYYIYLKELEVKVICAVKTSEISLTTMAAAWIIIIYIAAILIISVVVLLIISRRFLNPITDLISSIKKIKNGDYSERFTYKRNDEFGQIATAFNGLIDRIVANNAELNNNALQINIITENIPGRVYKLGLFENSTDNYISSGSSGPFKIPDDELSGDILKNIINRIHPDDKQLVIDDILESVKNEKVIENEFRFISLDGSIHWLMNRASSVIGSNGEQYIYGVVLDITDSKNSLDKLTQNEERFRIILNQIDAIICEFDFEKDTLSYSSKWIEKLGFHPMTESFYKNFMKCDHVHPEDVGNVRRWMDNILKKTDNLMVEARFKSISNNYLWLRMRSTIIFDNDGRPVKAIFIITDITSEKEEYNQLLQISKADPLTKLYNKVTTQNMVEEYICNAPDGVSSALLIVDIDNFKLINDRLGHFLGDSVLRNISSKLRTAFDANDIVGRIGGDEFIIFIRDAVSRENIIEKATIIKEIFLQTYADESTEYTISGSTGIAFFPLDGNNFNSLYRNADSALYVAKKNGKNCHEFYNINLHGLSYIKQYDNTEAIREGSYSNNLENNFVEYVFNVLYSADDINHAISHILEVIGSQYRVSRAYIFENSSDNLTCSNTFEWCNIGIKSEINNLQNVQYKDVANHQSKFNSQGIYYCSDIASSHLGNVSVMKPQGIKSLVHCAIIENGIFRGFVGFDDCSSTRTWTKEEISILSFISKVLSVFLLKSKVHDKLMQSLTVSQAIIDALEGWTYVIDSETMRLLFVNQNLKRLIPEAKVGELCYNHFGDCAGVPCRACPIADLRERPDLSRLSAHQYNKNLDLHVNTEVTRFSLKSKDDAYLICCKYRNKK